MYRPQSAPASVIDQAIIGSSEPPNDCPDPMEQLHRETGTALVDTDTRTMLGQTTLPAVVEFSSISTNEQHASRELDGVRISELLNADEMLEQVRLFEEGSRARVIGDLVEFCTIFSDAELPDLKLCLDNLTKTDCLVHPDKYPDGHEYAGEQWKYSAFVYAAAKRLGLSETESEDSQRKLFDFFNARKHGPNAYYYHGFNAVFEGSIKENGLDPNIRAWDWQELEDIQRICGKAGYTRAIGWSDLNCKSKISITDDPQFIYQYACTSPEWFGQFAAEGSHMNGEGIDKTAFYRKDYDAARRNVEIFCDKMTDSTDEDISQKKSWPNISAEDKQQVLDFFEKYWAKFAKNDSPRVALCRKNAVSPDGSKNLTFDEFIARGFATGYDHGINGGEERPATTDEIIQVLCGENLCSYFRANDKQIDHRIGSSNITVITLPEYSDIFPR